MNYVWDFQIVWEYRQVFVRGAIITAQLTFWATLLGKLLLVPSVVGSVIWGFAFLRKQPVAPAGRV